MAKQYLNIIQMVQSKVFQKCKNNELKERINALNNANIYQIEEAYYST